MASFVRHEPVCPEVLIVGAGIGGLTAALSLHAAGVPVRVVDVARELTPLGVGINLQPQAVRELSELGLGDALATLGVSIDQAIHYDRHGNLIWAEPRGVAAGYHWGQYAVHRGELQMMLLQAVLTRLGTDAVAPGLGFEDYQPIPGGVAVRLRDRNTGQLVRRSVTALIGADGLHSAVRARLHPHEGPPLDNGIRMWRGTVLCEPFLTGSTMVVAGCNTYSKFVAYPVSPVRDGLVLVNWVAESRLVDGDLAADWNARGRLDDVLPRFADWTFDWLDVPTLIKGSTQILEYPMVDRDPLPWWGTGRVTLLGDAAHPMYPIGSNGGSQAIIDARVLAYHLATAPDPVTGLARYESERREPANAVLLANRQMGPERILRTVADRAPDGFVRIEDVLSAEELADIGAAYRRTSTHDAELVNTRPSWSIPTA
ncbi:MAG: flavin-dependent oxidoreductase [Actinocatenispora sp.]